jgi:histidinol-phosphatase
MDAATMRKQVLHATCRDVATFVLSHFLAQNFTISSKSDGSAVTNVDIEAELMAREAILASFPEDGFLGEEHGEISGTSGFRWVVDPIDGTASFARGVPLFGTLIGLEHEGKPIAGIATLPALDETISAFVGEGAVYQGKIGASVSTTALLQNAMVCTTSYDYYKQTQSESLYTKLVACGSSLRGWSDCYAYLLLCTGRIDAVVEPLLYPWDINPWLPILHEAGGAYSKVGKGGIATNKTLHDSLCHALSCAP